MNIEPSPPYMAAHRVFNTVELLETVLLNIPVYDLFVLQRINKAFQQTIHGSPRIRRAMFLDADASSSRSISPAMMNPVLGPAFEKSLFQLPDEGFLDVRHHTILRTGGESTGRWLTTHFELYKMPQYEHWQRGRLLPRRKDFYESWRDMLLVQPAPVEIEVTVFKHPSVADRGGSSTAWFDGNMRLGDVFEWLEHEATMFGKHR